ncbi:indole-3-glycerol phosphate synthase TrpC [Spiribacter pallidus]|uniref:Indole-3-glycerol phosphate synthase n=1 Tax=Spiribacter pallidus TaxID=1987936 RepID=A0ABV3TDG5_9GAMM
MSALDSAPDILKRIVERKAERLEAARRARPEAALREALAEADAPRGFVAAIDARLAAGRPAVIAEAKKASPSKGVLRDPYNPAAVARSYEAGGASCLSVLTEADFFAGADAHLQAARAACTLPVIRKDFVIDPYQVIESRALGADCVLLIVAILDDARLKALHDLATELGMDVLVEVHDHDELARALAISPPLLGINNRDLRSFETDIATTTRLAAEVPNGTRLVCESGIHTRADVAQIQADGVNAFLVGEAFMRAEAPGEKLAELF